MFAFVPNITHGSQPVCFTLFQDPESTNLTIKSIKNTSKDSSTVAWAAHCGVFIRPLPSNGCLTSVSTVDLLTRTVA
jgi:hypothetical protein